MVCLKCCFWCLEKFIKFLNRNAYIMVNNRTELLPWVGGFPISIPWASNLLLFTPDCYLWDQLLHLSQERLLPAYEKYHQVRRTPLHPPACLSHLTFPSPPPALAPFLNQSSNYCTSPPTSPLSPALNLRSHCPFTLPYRVAVLDKVTDFLFLLGKLLIVGSVGEWSQRACLY